MRRLAAGLAAAVALAAAAGCASVPSSGPVMYRVADEVEEENISLVPPPPRGGADPEQLVGSFLNAGGAGATAPNGYETAELYLTDSAREEWSPTGNVVVYSGAAEYSLDLDGENQARIGVSVTAVARVDANGVYTEAPQAAPFRTSFTLVRGEDEQWRIDKLDDGVFVSTYHFANQFHATPLYFPTPDERAWVPDQRWFPRSSWRTSAVAAVLNGPPEWLQGAVGEAAPAGTQLAVQTVTPNEDGAYQVRLGEELADLDESRLSLLFAQLRATLTDADVEPEIALYAGESPLTEPAFARPTRPATRGKPVALSDGELFTVSEGRLTDFERPVGLEGLETTAIALGPDTTPLVVLDDDERIVQVTDVAGIPDGQRELMTSDGGLVPPSVDRYGWVWSSDDPGRDIGSDDEGRLMVAHESATPYPLGADWLAGREVIAVRVAPDGARLAVVSRSAGSTDVHVAAVVRNENNEPGKLTQAIEVAAPVSGVEQVQWSGETSLRLLTREDDGSTTMYEAGVGGLPEDGGGTRTVQELPGADSVTAGVTDSGALALTIDGDLYEEQTTGWGEPIAAEIDTVAYPG